MTYGQLMSDLDGRIRSKVRVTPLRIVGDPRNNKLNPGTDRSDHTLL